MGYSRVNIQSISNVILILLNKSARSVNVLLNAVKVNEFFIKDTLNINKNGFLS